jgi:hypothetical protein
VTRDDRRSILELFAREHRQQPGKLRHQFHGYDRHLRLDCPLCLVCGEMPSSVLPGEAALFQELMSA